MGAARHGGPPKQNLCDAATNAGLFLLLPVRCCERMTPERSADTSFQCFPAACFSAPLVTVNNLGLRRFIALHSKCSRRIRVLWPSYWSNWEDVQQSKRNSWEPHRMHGIRKGIGALISLWQAIQVVFRGLMADIKPPEAHFYPSFFFFFHVRIHLTFPCMVNINLHVGLKSQPVCLVLNSCRIFGLKHSR